MVYGTLVLEAEYLRGPKEAAHLPKLATRHSVSL
jgi:hypothetical protein